MIKLKNLYFILTFLFPITIFNNISIASVFEETALEFSSTKKQYSHSNFKRISEQWWSEFEESEEKDIVKYVYKISSTYPEAAAWFLLTGGKYGFANRQATTEEENLLLWAIHNVGERIGNIPQNYGKFLSDITIHEIKPQGLHHLYLMSDKIFSVEFENFVTKLVNDHPLVTTYTHLLVLKDYYMKYCIYLIDGSYTFWKELLDNLLGKNLISLS